MKRRLLMENWSRYVTEGEMTKPEIKKAHKLAKAMMPSTKKQYGSEKGEKVAYATGTKMAMKEEEEEELDEGMSTLEKALTAGVLSTWLGGIADAIAHDDPTAPVSHVLDAMYEIAKDMPPGEKVTAGSFAKHLGGKLAGMVMPDQEEED